VKTSDYGTKPTGSGVSTDRAARREDLQRRRRRVRRAHRYDWREALADAARMRRFQRVAGA
jgi:hypothetical protein